MPTDIRSHQLTKQVALADTRYTFDGSVYNNATSTTTGGWENIAVDFGAFPPLSITGVPLVFEYDFITSRKITVAELSTFFEEPGFLPSTLDLMQLIYAEKRVWGQNANIPGTYIIVDAETSGTGDATAMDKLHWTRLIVYLAGATTANVIASPTNLVVSAVTAKEKDLVWMERLRRSYVLQDQADV